MTTDFATMADYINRNPCAVLGTTSEDGTPHGAVLYTCALPNGTVCFLTKNQTHKYRNLIARPKVCLTFVNEKDSSSLQATGEAAVVTDARLMATILEAITRVQTSQIDWLPPLAKLRAGEYETIAVKITRARLAEYRGQAIGSQHIFTELERL
ncbi:MAG TPA: pyridoxamine 5'-phosphate oxidase family protein [Candidatus Saccharimonadales bacterium]|nr:pyridoxamine 5'-phosphate oxidase family protein [Candidatus Saccharimonadales bacterium]